MPVGQLLGVNTSGNVLKRESLEEDWAPWITDKATTDKSIVDLTILEDGTILGVDTDHTLCTKVNTTEPWVSVPDSGKVVAVTTMRDGVILAAGENTGAYTRPALTAAWEPVARSKSVKSVAVALDGTILGVGANGKLYSRETLESLWVVSNETSRLVNSVAVIEDGTIVGVGAERKLYTRETVDSPWVAVSNCQGEVTAVADLNVVDATNTNVQVTLLPGNRAVCSQNQPTVMRPGDTITFLPNPAAASISAVNFFGNADKTHEFDDPPYASSRNPDGSLQISDSAAGTIETKCWYSVTITDGANTGTVDPELINRP